MVSRGRRLFGVGSGVPPAAALVSTIGARVSSEAMAAGFQDIPRSIQLGLEIRLKE